MWCRLFQIDCGLDVDPDPRRGLAGPYCRINEQTSAPASITSRTKSKKLGQQCQKRTLVCANFCCSKPQVYGHENFAPPSNGFSNETVYIDKCNRFHICVNLQILVYQFLAHRPGADVVQKSVLHTEFQGIRAKAAFLLFLTSPLLMPRHL